MSNRVPIAPGLFTWPAQKPALLGSRCNDCGIVSFPVAQSCMACSGQDVSVEELPGRGTLWTWTVQQFMPKSPYNSGETPETFKPYGVGYLELPGGVRVEGRLTDHPDDAQGLVLRRIPPGFRNLAAPPSLASCTRDVYADDTRFSTAQALAIAAAMTSALAHLHQQGLVHGDLYAHNILIEDDDSGGCLLGDFGAASFLPTDDPQRCDALRRIDQRALGWLIDELAQRCDEPAALTALQANA